MVYDAPYQSNEVTSAEAGATANAPDTASVSELLWQHAFEVDSQINHYQDEYDYLVAALSTPLAPKDRGFAGRETREKQDQRYRALDGILSALKDQQLRVLSVIEEHDSGLTTDDEAVAAVLPDDSTYNSQSDSPHLSKRRKAIMRESNATRTDAGTNIYIDPWFGDGGLIGEMDFLQSLYFAADARRITTGRDRTKYVARSPEDTLTAANNFMHYTADTHGGKSRHNGKAGDHYKSASGRRIRKY